MVETDRILLACDSGLWWSQIPAAPSVKGVYNWAQAVPAGIGSKAFSGLAKGLGWATGGANGTIVASRFGGSAPNNIIYTAKWIGSKLVLTGSTVSIASTKLSRTSVAACASNPQIMYAAASDLNGQGMAGVFQSANGGVNWTAVTLPSNPGYSGDSNQAIAVSPDCSAVALGWQAGTFVSFTGGGSWNLLYDSGNYNNLHTGIHALTFDPVLPATLFIGSDGGVASASGLAASGPAPTFESDWNQGLFNVEFFDGAASASFGGLVAGATQDNGVLYASLFSGPPAPWQHVNDCSGLCPESELALFATPISIGSPNDLLVDATLFNPLASGGQYVESMGDIIPFNGQTGIPVNPPCSPCVNYNVTVAAPVRSPGGFFNSSGQRMIAVSEMYASPAGDGVYGLFANDDGSSVHWELLNAGPGLWSQVSAIAPTYDGNSIFIGDTNGRIFRMDSPFTGPAVQLTVNAPSPCPLCSVNGIYAFNKNLAFAAYGQHFMTWDGTSWNLTGEAALPHDREFLSIVALDTGRLYLASSAGVFDSTFEIDMFEHNSFPNGSDNWDIQTVYVTGYDSLGRLDLMQVWFNFVDGYNTCLARLKAPPNPSSVIYSLNSNDIFGVNQTHPVPNFGPTPPGSCPQ